MPPGRDASTLNRKGLGAEGEMGGRGRASRPEVGGWGSPYGCHLPGPCPAGSPVEWLCPASGTQGRASRPDHNVPKNRRQFLAGQGLQVVYFPAVTALGD